MSGRIQPYLMLRFGSASVERFALPEHTTTLGREPINDIILNEPEISRRHARIIYQDGTHYLEDLGSTNGTFVNGQRIAEPRSLRPNDHLDFGETVSFIYQMGDEAGQPAEPAPADTWSQHPPPAGDAPPTELVGKPAAATDPSPPNDQEHLPLKPGAAKWQPRRILIGCGCLIVLLIFFCAAAIFLLDAFASETLYCGSLQPLFESAGLVFNCPQP